MTTAEATAKFNEVLDKLKNYVAISSTMEHSRITVNAHIDVYHLGKRLTATLAIDKFAKDTDSVMILYYASLEYGFSFEDEAMIDARWKCKLPADVIDCPLVNVLEDATILDISYSMQLETLSKHMLVEQPKCPTQLLIYNLWKYIVFGDDFGYAVIHTDDQNEATIHKKDDIYECTLNGSALNNMRDLRDYLDGSKIKVHFVDGYIEYGYVNDLCNAGAYLNANKFSVMIDGKEVKWENGKWCDEEYLESHK